MTGRYAQIDENNVVTNIIMSDEKFASTIGAIYVKNLPITIGDSYDPSTNELVHKVVSGEQEVLVRYHAPIPGDKTPAEMRKQAYKTLRGRLDRPEALIAWEGECLTVDEANQLWMDYSAEGDAETTEQLSTLISFAKEYIRSIYPDEEVS